MDDPWANAWGDSDNLALSSALSANSVQPWTKSTQPKSTEDELEADIAAPSWSTGVAVTWAEPTAQDSLWLQPPDAARAWGASSYEDLPITTKPEVSTPPRSPSPKTADEPSLSPAASPVVTPQDTPEPPSLPLPTEEAIVATSPITRSPSLVPAASPDPFGTFETGLPSDNSLEGVDSWTPSAPTFPDSGQDSAQWGSTWTAPESEGRKETDDRKSVDEWEAAKQRKETQDRVVPPELLASILLQCEELSQNLWPDVQQDEKSDDWKKNGQNGMEGVEGLAALASKYLLEGMTLSPPVKFGKTATGKSLAEALKLTRHAPLTRLSPMSMYLASKGSTAWETSVKNRPEVKHDELPPGWRVVDKDKEPPSSVPGDASKGKRAGGGLLSFWGRKSSSSPLTETNRERSASPVSASKPNFTVGSPPRSSVDKVPSSPAPPSKATPAVVSSPTASIFAPTSVSSSAAVEPASVPTPQNLQPDVLVETPHSAPSAVSRFLNRFSRTKSDTSNQRKSLALSSDDLEFLSDVPSASDDVEADDNPQLRALSSMIGSSPLPTKLPPPLAPPPPPPPRTPSTTQPSSAMFTNAGSSGLESLIIGPDAGPSQSKLAVNTSKPASSLPPPLPLPLSPGTMLAPSPGISPRTHTPLAALATPPLSAASGSSLSGSFTIKSPTSRSDTVGFPSQSANVPLQEKDLSPSVLRPPPPPRPRTPVTTILPAPAKKSTLHGMLPPPPAAPSRSPTSKLVSATQGSLFDDDDFSDFHSSSQATSPDPVPVHPQNQPHDDFSGFHSQVAFPSSPSRHHNMSSYDSIFSSSTSSDRNLFSQSTSMTKNADPGFDDFDDFVSSPTRSPSPPRPPAKTPLRVSMIASPSPPPLILSPQRQQTPSPSPRASRHRKESSVSAADHKRTASLLEHAASRRGQWPAPPSPLPEALSPPSALASDAFDLFNNIPQQDITGTPSLNVGLRATPSPPARLSLGTNENGTRSRALSPPLPPPPGFALPSNQSFLKPSSPARSPLEPSELFVGLSVMPAKPAKTSSQGQTGGLSAQDLSFFEGL